MEISKGASCGLTCNDNAVAVGTNEGEVAMLLIVGNTIQYEYKQALFDLPATAMAFNSSGTRVVAGSPDYTYAYLSTRHRYSWWVWALAAVVVSWAALYVLPS